MMTWPMLTAFDWGPGFSPFRELLRLQREMNRLFEGYTERYSAFPAANLWTSKDDAVVTVEIPGVDPKSLNVTLKADSLVIEGEKPAEPLKQDDVTHRQERACGRFSKVIRLPFQADPNGVKAAYARGILKVTLPRSEAAKPKAIPIEAAS